MGEEHFTLALRNHQPSVATCARRGRVVLADVPWPDRASRIRWARIHRLKRIDWCTLPCDTVRSARHGFRVPAQSPRFRELDIVAAQPRGSPHHLPVPRHRRRNPRQRAAAVPHQRHPSRLAPRPGHTPWREPQPA
jgi:hypothetical protein